MTQEMDDNRLTTLDLDANETSESTDATVDLAKERGPALVHHLFSAMKTVQVHDLSNNAAQRALSEMLDDVRALQGEDGKASLRLFADYLQVNGVRPAIDPQSIGPFLYLAGEMKKREVETIEFLTGITPEELGKFLIIMSKEIEAEDVFEVLYRKMAQAGITRIRITQWIQRDRRLVDMPTDVRDVRRQSNQVFFHSVSVMKEVMKGIQERKVIQIRRAKRLTQQMVDLIQVDESILVGLTSIKNFDEYTFAHSVNVCILSMLVADRLRFYKSDTARLGVSALFHDIGKMSIPYEILNKPEKLAGADWELMKYHTFLGVKELSNVNAMRGVADAMMVALQHHVHFNMNGYPQKPNRWDLRLFTRIVSVADYYDAMTTPRVYAESPVTPDKALQFILMKSGEIFDPFISKVFIQAMGIYPVGTVVELDSGEVGVVVKQNENSRFMHRPTVRLLQSRDSGSEDAVTELDLSERGSGSAGFARSVVRVIYDIEVEKTKAHYFVTAQS